MCYNYKIIAQICSMSLYPNLFSLDIRNLILASVVFIGLSVFILIGYRMWVKVREINLLKYEFITIIIHKFRTPLTHIKWSSEELKKATTDEAREAAFQDIQKSNERLIELTDILASMSASDTGSLYYDLKPLRVAAIVQEVYMKFENHFRNKGMKPRFHSDTDAVANLDKKQFAFVLQTLIENAVMYSYHGGQFDISVSQNGNKVLVKTLDNGIGIPKVELPHIFEKFHRSGQAKLANTEGLGIGIYLSKKIIKQHRGKIRGFSEGEGKGATFTITLPKA